MGQIFRVVLSLSISGSLVGLLLLLFRPAAGRFLTKRWTYYLWLLVLARLLVPVHAGVNLMERLSAVLAEADSRRASTEGAFESEYVESAQAESRQVSVEEASESGYAENIEAENPQISLEDASGSGYVENTESEKQEGDVSGIEGAGDAGETFDMAAIENAGLNETVAVASVDSQRKEQRANILQIAGILWILGVFLTAIYKVCTYKNFVKGINSCCIPVTDQRIWNKSAEIHTRLGLVKAVSLYENTAVNTPMLIGLRKPYIILPSKLLAEMAGRGNDICLILHHELIHYKRRDIWYKWLFQAVLCVHWFNPLLYLFNRKFNVDCELSCDEAVMALLSEEGRRIYGNVLLDVAEKNLPEETFIMHRNVPTMTLLEEKRTLKERLQGIAGYERKGFIIGFCSALALVAFIVVAVMCGVAGMRADSGEVSVVRNGSQGVVGRFIGNIAENTKDLSFLEEPILVSKNGKPYRMYDDDALIAGESVTDTWQAWNYYGGERGTNVGKFVLNGSDVVRIVYVNKETTLEMTSAFTLHSGRFKIVQVMPDQTVQVLNEDGKEISGEITLPEGRNCFKMVGQKARVEDVKITYSGADQKDIDGIYYSEEEEYAYRVLAGQKPIDMARLEEVYVYLDAEEVSKFCRNVWDSGTVLSNDNWVNLFAYSDEVLAGRYLVEALQAGKIEEFDSRILVGIAPYMKEKDVSECFRCLLERGKVSESDWEYIFVYSDADLSAQYLMEALKESRTYTFTGKFLEQISPRVSSKGLTDLVLALGKDELTFSDLRDDVMPYLGEEETMQCVFHYIDLGNVLTDSQLRDVQPYISEGNFYRVIEYNGKRK